MKKIQLRRRILYFITTYSMEKYSHGPFEVSGYRVTIANPEKENEIIMTAWKDFFSENMSDRITDKEYPTVHTVYYNYHDAHNLEKK